MDKNPEEVAAIRQREAAAVRQGILEATCEPLPNTAVGSGGGTCTPMHYSQTAETGGATVAWDYAEAAHNFRKALVRGGWLEE